MSNFRTRPGRVLSFPPATILFLAAPLLAACTIVHGDDPSSVPSHVDAPPDPAFADAVESARALVRARMVEENLPGLSLAVGVDGKIVWAEGFGWADVEERVPVTPRTRFRIGGVAMPITATAVGLLLERGQIDLDAPVRQYVPGFPEKEWPVTPRQLMAHVAGLRGFYDDEEPLYQKDHCETAVDGLGLYADDALAFEPGTRYHYSVYGWTLVGAVVESAADEPFLEFLQREVLDPLGMRDTVLDAHPGPVDNSTSFYFPAAIREPGYGVHDANNGDQTCFQGAGALLSTPTDVVRFGHGILDGGLMRPETLEMLQTPLELAGGRSTGHGLGWFVREISTGPESATTTAFGHGGSSAGGTTSFVTVPEHGIVIAITTNVSFASSLAVDAEIGGGLDPFLHDSSLSSLLVNTFAQAAAAQR